MTIKVINTPQLTDEGFNERSRIIIGIANHIEETRLAAQAHFGVELDPDTYANDFTFTMAELQAIIDPAGEAEKTDTSV
jgi:hypothetical protein